jgi:hypothetical protein
VRDYFARLKRALAPLQRSRVSGKLVEITGSMGAGAPAGNRGAARVLRGPAAAGRGLAGKAPMAG